MNKAYMTVVVTGTTCSTLLDELKDEFGGVQVVSQGDIDVSEKDLDSLPTDIWLYDGEGFKDRKIMLVSGAESDSGRVLTKDEMDVLQKYGVCVEFQAAYPTGKLPLYTVHTAAAEVEVSKYGFSVPEEGLDLRIWAAGDDTERRWMRIKMPAWFNLAA